MDAQTFSELKDVDAELWKDIFAFNLEFRI